MPQQPRWLCFFPNTWLRVAEGERQDAVLVLGMPMPDASFLAAFEAEIKADRLCATEDVQHAPLFVEAWMQGRVLFGRNHKRAEAAQVPGMTWKEWDQFCLKWFDCTVEHPDRGRKFSSAIWGKEVDELVELEVVRLVAQLAGITGKKETKLLRTSWRKRRNTSTNARVVFSGLGSAACALHATNCMTHTPQHWMNAALTAAERAAEKSEVPIGAVIVHNGAVVAEAHNETECLHDATAHAEILAIRRASAALGRWRLDDCDLYVTVEPCPMCIGAMILARIPRLYFGCYDAKLGAVGSLFDLSRHDSLPHKIEVFPQLLETQCRDVLQEFFAKRR